MRISDWRSDLCSSDLELWEPGERPKAHSRQEGEAVRPRHRKSGSSVIAWTKSRPSRSWLRASTSSSFAARGVDLNGLVTFVNLVDRLNERVGRGVARSEEHTSELQSLMRTSYAVFCLQKKKT